MSKSQRQRLREYISLYGEDDFSRAMARIMGLIEKGHFFCSPEKDLIPIHLSDAIK